MANKHIHVRNGSDSARVDYSRTGALRDGHLSLADLKKSGSANSVRPFARSERRDDQGRILTVAEAKSRK